MDTYQPMDTLRGLLVVGEAKKLRVWVVKCHSTGRQAFLLLGSEQQKNVVHGSAVRVKQLNVTRMNSKEVICCYGRGRVLWLAQRGARLLIGGCMYCKFSFHASHGEEQRPRTRLQTLSE